MSVMSAYLTTVARFTPGLPPYEAAIEFLPWLFRWIAFLLILPVLVLLFADFFSCTPFPSPCDSDPLTHCGTDLYFRAVYQPWGRARTAFYKFPQRWAASRPSSRQHSPVLQTSGEKGSSSSPSTDEAGFLKPGDQQSEGSAMRLRTHSIQNARTLGLGVDGPLFEPQSPNLESEVPLPDIDEGEEDDLRSE